MTIDLPKEKREALTETIQAWFLDEMGEEIGRLKAEMALDWVLAEIGPSIYNQAIRDAQSYFQERALDLDAVLHEPEAGPSRGKSD